MHLDTFYSLDNNPLYSEFLIKQKFPLKDHIIKFAFKARTNSLGTPEFDEILNNKKHTPCHLCLRHGRNSVQSLAHILNGCVSKFNDYTTRHNRLQSILIEHIKKIPSTAEIQCDKKINIDSLPPNLSKLRPDIVIWNLNRTACKIIEISVPYASITWGEDALKKAYDEKKLKYKDLIEWIRNQNISVEYFVIIVSSVGAVFQESIADVHRLFPNKKIARTLIKRLAINAIMGSMDVWYRRNTPINASHSDGNIDISPSVGNEANNGNDKTTDCCCSTFKVSDSTIDNSYSDGYVDTNCSSPEHENISPVSPNIIRDDLGSMTSSVSQSSEEDEFLVDEDFLDDF